MIIMINIVSGIIIDTFGSIREEDKKFKEDVNNTCFICGNNRETLDKAFEQKQGFKIHTTVSFKMQEIGLERIQRNPIVFLVLDTGIF